MTETFAPVTYKTMCAWCILHRPGLAPNYVAVAVPNSTGVCKDCSEVMFAQIRQKRAEREAAK